MSSIRRMKQDENTVYMWEDKGSSFVKMTKDQYLQAGRKELGNTNIYEEVLEDPSTQIKEKNDIIVEALVQMKKSLQKLENS